MTKEISPAQCSDLAMEDIGLTCVNRNGLNSQSQADHVPTDSHRATLCSCYAKSLKCIKYWLPVDWKNEIIQLFKLAGPVVSLGFNTT